MIKFVLPGLAVPVVSIAKGIGSENATWTRPSRKAYKASRYALCIRLEKSAGMGCKK